jgi:hypothetical protein
MIHPTGVKRAGWDYFRVPERRTVIIPVLDPSAFFFSFNKHDGCLVQRSHLWKNALN